MGKHNREDLNTKPFDEGSSASQKAEEFDAQVRQNGGDPNPQPELYGNWAPQGSEEDRRG